MTNTQDSLTQDPLTYPYAEVPAPGTTIEIAPGVKWLQMPLPMSLNHINLYLVEEDDGWAIIDTGIRGEETQLLWDQIIANELDGKPISRVICTHMHPDHTGQVGFLCEKWNVPLYMSYSEYYQTRVMHTMMSEGGNWKMSQYYIRAGVEQSLLDSVNSMRGMFAPEPDDTPIPKSFIRLTDGDSIQLGKHQWDIFTGTGHSPEHVCLYSKDLRLLLSGDQVLPVITSNVSIQPTEPYANPMQGWLASHERFKTLIPNDTLVLPAHNSPFYGVQERLQQLIEHHEDRMLILEENCIEPRGAIELLPYLFDRKLEGQTILMAIGECIAHLHCLISNNRIERTLNGEVYQYRSIDPTLQQRTRPEGHEPLVRARPEMV
ncbi:MAG: MBL fold metallo-hydrolase [Pseudomonadales bacterium]|nr:MBL fold metallo-hydrolase [Pseudomonadales bacterium]